MPFNAFLGFIIFKVCGYKSSQQNGVFLPKVFSDAKEKVEDNIIFAMEQNFLKVMKVMKTGKSIIQGLNMPYKRCWACKQKIILWWSKWPGRNAVLSRFCYLWRWQFNSSNLLLTFIAPLRNWPNSTKSFRRLKVFNFSLEYKIFFELMEPKLFKNFSCVKWWRTQA